MYRPVNYDKINLYESSYNPSMVKAYNNAAFSYWQRSLFQRAQSTIIADGVPVEWSGSVEEYMIYCLFRYGWVAPFNSAELGFVFSPGTLSEFDFFYQPLYAIISNPKLKQSVRLKIGEDTELLKLTPDYMSVFDTINYYAEKLACLDNAINMSIINNKFAYILGARNKGMAEALKKMMDKINKGEPAVIYDQRILNDTQDKDVPYQFLERSNMKQSYLTTDQLRDFQTILNNFDAEVGIPTIPYEKKERMVASEADSRMIDSQARSTVWLDSLNRSAKKVNDMFGTDLSFRLRYVKMGVENE